MSDKSRVKIEAANLVVDLGKSKRLAAIRQSLSSAKTSDNPVKKQQPKLDKKELAIKVARDLISQKIAEIKASYPQGRQNKLFALRYGSEDGLQKMTLKELFAVLKISEGLAKELADVKFLKH